MPSKTGNKYSDFYKRDLQINQSSNTGVDATPRTVQSGDGVDASLALGTNMTIVQPRALDTSTAFQVANKAGAAIFSVDSDNTLVKAGLSQVNVNTQYAHFMANYGTALSSLFVADTHYMIRHSDTMLTGAVASFALGTSTTSSFNDTDPASSLTIADTAMEVLTCYWYVMDDITIDAVKWLHAADTATGDSTAAHLMAYTVDIANGSTGGDLSGGTVVADGATITNAGYEQIYYQSMTIQSADVDAGKVILFTFAADTVNSDYSISATVKYHLR